MQVFAQHVVGQAGEEAGGCFVFVVGEIDRERQAKRDRQRETGRERQAERDRQSETGRVRHRQSETGRVRSPLNCFGKRLAEETERVIRPEPMLPPDSRCEATNTWEAMRPQISSRVAGRRVQTAHACVELDWQAAPVLGGR